MLWRCWLGGRKGIRPVKNWVVRCWCGYLSGAWCRLAHAQLMPLPLTISCSSKIQIGFTFLVPAHPGSPGQRAVKRVCVFLNVLIASTDTTQNSGANERCKDCITNHKDSELQTLRTSHRFAMLVGHLSRTAWNSPASSVQFPAHANIHCSHAPTREPSAAFQTNKKVDESVYLMKYFIWTITKTTTVSNMVKTGRFCCSTLLPMCPYHKQPPHSVYGQDNRVITAVINTVSVSANVTIKCKQTIKLLQC